jgi:CelD/BcsL family acetyltransferase involved in cellulose biosynthesis
MRIATLQIDDPRWLELVLSHEKASPFHLPAWTKVIAECYGFKTLLLAVEDPNGELVGGMPVIAVRSPLGSTRWISLPYSDSCPPLLKAGVELSDLASALREHISASPVSEFEIRCALPAEPGVYPVEVGYHHTMSVARDVADLHPRKSQRENRNRAVRLGVEIVRGTEWDDLETFYRLHTLTRRRHGVPVQPIRLFRLIWDRLISAGHGWVLSAVYEGQVVVAGVYLSHNGTLVAKYHASDPGAPCDIGAGHLIEWRSMVIACEEGYHTLDVGRTDTDAEGLRLYKSGWGHSESPLVYTHLSVAEPKTSRPHVSGLARQIIRSSPLWVCRSLGEVLYRWTA